MVEGKFQALVEYWEKYNIFTLLASVFGILTLSLGLFFVESKAYEPFILYFLKLFSSVEGLICAIPFVIGLILVLIQFISQFFEKFVNKNKIPEIPPNILLKLGCILIIVSIFLLYVIYLAWNPQEYYVMQNPENPGIIIDIVPGAYWPDPSSPWYYFYCWYYYNCAATYVKESVMVYINAGFVCSILMVVFILSELILKRVRLRHYYKTYLPDYLQKKTSPPKEAIQGVNLGESRSLGLL